MDPLKAHAGCNQIHMTFAEDKLLTRTAPVSQHTKLPTIHAIVTSDYFQIAKIDLKELPVIQTPNSPFYCCRLPPKHHWEHSIPLEPACPTKPKCHCGACQELQSFWLEVNQSQTIGKPNKIFLGTHTNKELESKRLNKSAEPDEGKYLAKKSAKYKQNNSICRSDSLKDWDDKARSALCN